jgi:2-C-methyl-D-erythritol 4-phosphate cytidylyltransferase
MSSWRSASAPRPRPSATALIAAAGSGERLGAGGAKALVELAGRPMLAWSLDAFAAAESIGAIVIAVPPAREAELEAVASESAGEMPLTVVRGGDSRSESVSRAMDAVDAELVAVHDAARPLVTAELIDGLIDALASRPDADAAIAVAPLTDTVKRSSDPRAASGEAPGGAPAVAETLSRDHLWAAQTPQVFRTEKLREALDADPQRLAAATDDAMLVENAGGKVLMHAVPPWNLKVTTPLDLRVAELLLADRPR